MTLVRPLRVRLGSLRHFWSWLGRLVLADLARPVSWTLCEMSGGHLVGILAWEVAGVRVSLCRFPRSFLPFSSRSLLAFSIFS